MPDQKGEFYAGHTTFGKNTDYANLDMEISYSTSELQTDIITASTDHKGDFAFLIPSNSTINSVTARASGFKTGEMANYLRISNPDYRFTGESTSDEISGDVILKEGTVGNKYFDIALDTAVLIGVEDGIMTNLSQEFDIPHPYASPNYVGNNWDLTGLKSLYLDSFPYNSYIGQAWYISLCTKIRDFVTEGGTVYLTGDSHSIALYLSSHAGANIQFFPTQSIYPGAHGTRIIPVGSLKEAIKAEDIGIAYVPYDSGGALLSNIGSAEMLAQAEVAINNPLSLARFPAAVSFNLGRGKVFYSSFPIPSDLIGAIPPDGMSAMSTTPTPLQSFARWFMAKPIANAELVRLSETYDIENNDAKVREDSTVGEMKTTGLPLSMKMSEDAAVVTMISGMVMSKMDYSTIPVDYDKHKRWTASLSDSSGNIYETRTTSGDMMVFQVKSNDNNGGTWRIKIENSTPGYLDENLFVVMVVEDERSDIVDNGWTVDDPGFITVAGVNISPTSANLAINSTLQLTASIIPSDATSQDVIWSTTSSDIVSVDANGFVTALSVGTAKVIVTTENCGYTAEAVITVTSGTVPVTGVTLNYTAANIAVGSTLQLIPTVLPLEAMSRDVSWSSSNSSVATVNASGVVTAISAGTATITVTTVDGNKTASCYVATVIPVVNIQVTPSTLTLEENGQDTLNVIFTPPNATNQALNWSTSDAMVATVNSGVVTAHAAGTATITAAAEGGKTSYCTVTVKMSKLTYYQNKYPGKYIIILSDGGALSEAFGNTVIVGGAGHDLIEFSGTSNVFVYEQGGGHDVITSVNVNSGDSNELHFGPGITSADLSFIKISDDLYVSISDEYGNETGSVTIEGWYLTEEHKLKIVLDDGTELTPVEIEELVQSNETPAITTLSLPSSNINAVYYQKLGASGSTPINWSLYSGFLPNDLDMNGNGVISGRPTMTGTSYFTVKAENDAGFDTKSLSISVSYSSGPPVITTTSLSGGNESACYYHPLSALGAANITWSIDSGNLPPGLKLYNNGNNGMISGLPTIPGTYSFVVKATNSYGSDTKPVSIIIKPTTMAPLTGGYIETVAGIHQNDELITQNEFNNTYYYDNPFVRFVPIPSNAAISSIKWDGASSSESYVEIDEDEGIESYALMYGSGGYANVDVLVNGGLQDEFTMRIIVESYIDKSPRR